MVYMVYMVQDTASPADQYYTTIGKEKQCNGAGTEHAESISRIRQFSVWM